MAATVIHGDKVVEAPGAKSEESRLWIAAPDLAAATGWELKPEGMCRDEVCIPVPASLAATMLRKQDSETLVDMTAFASYVGQPYANDAENRVWSFGESPTDLRTQLLSLEAPDFTLPAYDGSTYSLSGFRNKKVFLLLWSSW